MGIFIAVNVAAHMTADSSSDYHTNDARPIEGVDGEYYGNSFFHTKLETDAYFSVDLGHPVDIARVIISNRATFSKNATILLCALFFSVTLLLYS